MTAPPLSKNEVVEIVESKVLDAYGRPYKICYLLQPTTEELLSSSSSVLESVVEPCYGFDLRPKKQEETRE